MRGFGAVQCGREELRGHFYPQPPIPLSLSTCLVLFYNQPMKKVRESFGGSVEHSLTLQREQKHNRARRFVGVLAAALSLSTLTSFSGSDHQPFPYEKGAKIAELGESFAAGSGVGPFEEGTNVPGHDGNRCRRSTNTTAHQLADAHGLEVVAHPACNGAKINELYTGRYGEKSQIDTLNDEIDIVVLSIGGNDAIDLSEFMNECATNGCSPDSIATRSLEAKIQSEEFRQSLKDTYVDVSHAAPNSTVYVMPYPNPLPEGSLCSGIIGEDISDTVKKIIPNLNESIQYAVNDAQADGYSVYAVEAFDMSACDVISPPYVIDREDPLAFGHPNEEGYRRMSKKLEETMLAASQEDSRRE